MAYLARANKNCQAIIKNHWYCIYFQVLDFHNILFTTFFILISHPILSILLNLDKIVERYRGVEITIHNHNTSANTYYINLININIVLNTSFFHILKPMKINNVIFSNLWHSLAVLKLNTQVWRIIHIPE